MKAKIFSGDASIPLWKEIKTVRGAAGEALYLLGCKLQELEGEFRELQELVEQPKQQSKRKVHHKKRIAR